MAASMCVRGIARTKELLTTNVAGTIRFQLRGFGLDHQKTDFIVAVHEQFHCNASLKSLPIGFGYSFRAISSSGGVKMEVQGEILAPGSYRLCFASWVWGNAEQIQSVFKIRQRVLQRTIRIPRSKVVAGDNFHVAVNGSGLNAYSDRIVLLEARNCDLLIHNAVGSIPSFALLPTVGPSSVRPISEATSVVFHGSGEVAGDYSLCYELHTEPGKWVHLVGFEPTTNLTLRLWSSVRKTLFRGLDLPHFTTKAGRRFTVIARGRGLDITRDSLYLQRSLPGLLTCDNGTIRNQPLLLRFRTVAIPFARSSGEHRGLRESHWNVSLPAQGRYIVCYVPYQLSTPVQLELFVNITAQPARFQLFRDGLPPFVGRPSHCEAAL
jgi:hypothetical protein